MTPLSYAEFGEQFIRQAISADRIQRELTGLLSEPISGSVSKLHADLLNGSYKFKLKAVVVEALNGRPEAAFKMHIKGTLALVVKIVGIRLKFTLEITIRLSMEVKTFAPVIVKLDVPPINGDAVDIEVDSHDLPGDILDKFNIIETAVRAEIVDEVNARIGSGAIAEASRIDVLKLAESASLTSAIASVDSEP